VFVVTMQAGVPDPWFQIKDKDGKCLGLSKDGLTVEPHTCDADDKHLFQTIDSAEHPVSLNFDSQCKYTFLKFSALVLGLLSTKKQEKQSMRASLRTPCGRRINNCVGSLSSE